MPDGWFVKSEEAWKWVIYTNVLDTTEEYGFDLYSSGPPLTVLWKVKQVLFCSCIFYCIVNITSLCGEIKFTVPTSLLF